MNHSFLTSSGPSKSVPQGGTRPNHSVPAASCRQVAHGLENRQRVRPTWLAFGHAMALGCLLALAGNAAFGQTVLSIGTIRDKIKGGWVGQMAGVCWGDSREFYWNNVMGPDANVPTWTSSMINNGFGQDDVYVEIPFIDTMKNSGVNCSWVTFGNAFKNTQFGLWHANFEGRTNLLNGTPAPASGDYLHNVEYDDIDWQIEANFSGIVAPGLPMAAADIAWRGGHVMNWGNGVYGGVMVGAMQARAYTATNLNDIIETGRQAIPAGTKFRNMIEDCIAQKNAGQTWDQCWSYVTPRYRRTSKAFTGDPSANGATDCDFIDVNQNASYVLIGLLYGNGDLEQSMRIAMRCGCDADCNPSTVGGILGAYLGFSNIPSKFTSSLNYTTKFSYTSYSIQDCIDLSEALARRVLAMSGGTTNGSGTNETWTIPAQATVPIVFEQCLTTGDPRNPISNPAPALTASLVSITNLTANFAASATDTNGMREYVWFFGDLTYSRAQNPVHTYLQPGIYTATAYAANSNGYTAWRQVTVFAGDVAPGMLSGSYVTTPSSVNLTTEGTADWIECNQAAANVLVLNRKTGVTAQIPQPTTTGGATFYTYSDSPTGTSWSDGTPTASATNDRHGWWVRNVGAGYQLILNASTNERVLTVYGGAWSASARFRATLSDSSAPAYEDTSLTAPVNTAVNRAYTLHYKAGSPGQTLTITMEVTAATSTDGNVKIDAATLQGVAATNSFPLNIPGCKLWLKSDDGVTADGSGNVSAWADRSGSGFNLTPSGTAPKLVANVLNGQPVVRFATSGYLFATQVLSTTTNATMFMVCQGLKGVSQKMFDGNFSGTAPAGTTGQRRIVTCEADGTVQMMGLRSGNFTNTQYLCASATLNSTSGVAKLFLNGASAAVSNNFYLLSCASPFTVGSRFGGTDKYGGDISEILVYDGVMSDPDRQAVESYLNAKWFVSPLVTPTRMSCAFSNGQPVLASTGVSNCTYTLQRSALLSPPAWSNIATVAADSQGRIRYVDTNAPSPNGFYRTRYP